MSHFGCQLVAAFDWEQMKQEISLVKLRIPCSVVSYELKGG